MHRGPQRRKGSSSKNCFFNITFSGYVALHIYLLLVVASTCAYSVVTVVWSVGTCNDLKIRASSHPVLGARDDVCVCSYDNLKCSSQNIRSTYTSWLFRFLTGFQQPYPKLLHYQTGLQFFSALFFSLPPGCWHQTGVTSGAVLTGRWGPTWRLPKITSTTREGHFLEHGKTGPKIFHWSGDRWMYPTNVPVWEIPKNP